MPQAWKRNLSMKSSFGAKYPQASEDLVSFGGKEGQSNLQARRDPNDRNIQAMDFTPES